tara:strand:- start:369 stop:1778 length:1410 start_codon:yes stop_codon:yes gene_type:complete
VASLITRKNGTKEIQFVDEDDKRQGVYLGKCSQRDANRAKGIVEDLITAKRVGGDVRPASQEWLAAIDDKLHGKLSKVGLVDAREATKLEAFIDRYIASRTDLKPRTIIKFNATKDYLIEHFGADCDITKINEGEAEEFRIFLLSRRHGKEGGETMGENTVRKHCQIVKQFFNKAIKLKLIKSNPFNVLPSTIQANKTRFFFIDQTTIEKVIDACPDQQWRLIFGLARFGGLRCPSEILDLKWSDIDWAEEEMTVRSDKTEHHTGQEQRIVPIFSDLLPMLREGFEMLEEGGSEFVISRYRDGSQNLRTQAHRIIKRAGFSPWPKTFQNLRSSLATDLVEFTPLHIAAQWTGHSVETMRKFYLQVTKEHRQKAKRREKEEKATANPQQSAQPTESESSDNADNSRANASDNPQQNPQQSVSENPSHGRTDKSEKGVLSIRNSDCRELSERENSGRGTRTPDTRIMIPLL